MPGRRLLAGLATAGVAAHLLLGILVVTHAVDGLAGSPAAEPAIRAMAYYDALTFSSRKFGFFAPEVSGDCQVELLLFRDSEMPENRPLRFENREMQVKAYAMIGALGAGDDSMDLLARSLALHTMNEDPSVKRVDVLVHQNQIPTMQQYRLGKRVERRQLYRTTFSLSGSEIDGATAL